MTEGEINKKISRRKAVPAPQNQRRFGTVLLGVLHRTLRSELLGKPVRLTDVAPGMVKTEFSLNRFDGDAERAGDVLREIVTRLRGLARR